MHEGQSIELVKLVDVRACCKDGDELYDDELDVDVDEEWVDK